MNLPEAVNFKNSGPSRIRNSRGQISIFIALIFNILFVFFAMVINVGMLVHDKINLQNSVDLAAYYAAAKQAEQLNAIAHTNYQIRQSWKLLAWRIRALGDMGRPNHPLYPGTQVTNMNEDAAVPNPTGRPPSVCIGHNMWADGTGLINGKPTSQNLCANTNFIIPKIPQSPNLFSVLDINAVVSQFATVQQNVTLLSCQDVGALDWLLAAQWYLGYRFDIANKKKAIRNIAQQLSNSGDDFNDITGASVRAGALATLQNNLTRANLDGLSGSSVQLLNSLNGNGSGDWTKWLHETFIYPLIYYADIYGDTTTGCNGAITALNPEYGGTPPTAFKDNASLKQTLDPGGEISTLLEEPGGTSPNNTASLYHSSLG